MTLSGRSHDKPHPPKARSSRLAMVNICLAAGIVMLIVVETIMTNNQVADGGQSNALQQQKSQLSEQVSQLSTEVSQYKSLSYINDRAINHLKMEPIQKNLWYLPDPQESQP